ncbi:MAG: twin-arginine translocation signal domain-containing protein [Bacteroidaceae bacterium]|nr:twin-arginine translocation signal domain-containing protein [Bacteroidaceae bacterium]
MKRRDFLTRIGILGAAGLMGNQTLQAAYGKSRGSQALWSAGLWFGP